MTRTPLNINLNSETDYFTFEEKSELRHEFVNNYIYELSGVSKFHNNIVLNLVVLFSKHLKDKRMITFGSFKLRIEKDNYFYPDFMICENNCLKYYAEKPVFIAQILSPSTRKFNLADKFIQYQKADTLQSYLCIEPEQKVVIFYFKTEEGEWMTETYTDDNDTITLSYLAISIVLKDIYQSS